MRPQNRLNITAIAFLVFAWLAWTAWARPLMLPDEGRYVGVAWEMLRSGDWLTPTLNGLPYFHKPPLFYWITAGSLWLFGQHEWAARVASLLGGVLGATTLYMFVRRWASERSARAALMVLLAQPLWLIAAQFANLDMLVAGCISATIVLLAHAVLLAEQGYPNRSVLIGAWAMAAFGVLAKGLIGFVLPALVIFVWLVLQKRWRSLFALLWWPGVLVFLVLTAPWFVLVQQRFPEFLDYFFVVQHFKRFTESGFNNVMPFWFYPAILFACFLPWLTWMVRALKNRASPSESHRAVRLLMLVWPAMIVLFFSMPKSKLLGYVLPAVPPLAYLAAEGFLLQTSLTRISARLWQVSAGIGCALALGVVGWLSIHSVDSTQAFALAIRKSRHASEPIVMLDKYFFDFPFYARLLKPIAVVGNWTDPNIQKRDSQRKELFDAGQFEKTAAAKLLVMPAALPALLCHSTTSWVLGPSSSPKRYPFLSGASVVLRESGDTLWRIDAKSPAMLSALACG